MYLCSVKEKKGVLITKHADINKIIQYSLYIEYKELVFISSSSLGLRRRGGFRSPFSCFLTFYNE